jgi:hypothetical protein
MKNHFIKNRCLAVAWMVAVMVLTASAAHAQSGATKYANTCAGCHGAAPGFATRPSVHKASANAAAIPHYLPGDADIAAFIPPDRPQINPPGAADLTANSAKLNLRSSYTTIITGYTVSCTGGGATKTASGAPTPGIYYTAITVTGLTAGTAYNCSATATNASGTSLASAVSFTTNPPNPPPPPPPPLWPLTVRIWLEKSTGQGGGAVQCPVQYSSSNPPRWLIRVSARLPRLDLGPVSLPDPSVKFQYWYKVNGYTVPGHDPGIPVSVTSVSYNPPTRGNYNFEVTAKAFRNEKAISLAATSAISCKVE